MTVKCPKCQTDNPDSQKFCGECATPLPGIQDEIHTKTLETPIEELTRGSIFAGRYEIIEELGKGGMGRVYRVDDTRTKEEIALKLIKPEIAADKKTIERFRNELTTARKIAHRNVCRMFDLGEEMGLHFITMEYISGQDLKGLIRQTGQLTVGKAISLAKQICEGLTEAHSLGVVHRDLKPNNIMIDRGGNAKIMDFGIARSLSAKGITGKGVMIGTPEYMSPEQVEGKEVDKRSDIYSLGIILYEMTTGRLPFEGETPLAVAMKHKGDTAKNPRELNPQIPDELSGMILKCLEKDKENRYQSASEVRSELERLEQGIPTASKETSKRKPLTSKEINVSFQVKKLVAPAFVVLAVVIAGLIIWSPWSKDEVSSTPADRPSIAVLPFNDFSPQKDQESLCEGFAESLINALAKIKDLRVPASTSSFFFKDREQNLQEIGRKLDVKTVLEGSVQKSADRLRITVKLINVEDEDVLWTEQYDRVLDDVFSIQDDISLKIVDKLKINLLGEEKEELTKRYTENVEAYNLYVQGRYFWNKRTPDGFEKAIEYFEKAIEKDPDYALAYAGIADVYNLAPLYSPLQDDEAYPKAKEATLKALEIDDTLAEAHVSLAFIKMRYEWDFEAAEKEFIEAIELNPTYATAHHWFAICLGRRTRFDRAIQEIERARELDPLSLVINKDTGNMYYCVRRYDKAIDVYQRAIELDPNFPHIHFYLGKAYLEKSLYEEALAEFQKEEDLIPVWIPNISYFKGIIYIRMGQREKALELLDKLIKESTAYFGIASIYFALDEKDLGFEWLEKAYEIRHAGLLSLRTGPEFDSVRSDPRFKAFVKKVGLE